MLQVIFDKFYQPKYRSYEANINEPTMETS